jgi:hypothetical protein
MADMTRRPTYTESLYAIKSAYENLIRYNEPQADDLTDLLFAAYQNAIEQIARKEHSAVGAVIGRVGQARGQL